jgi:hypothetical protein
VALAGLALLGLLALPRLLGAAAGPEAAILGELRRLEAEGLTLPVPGASAPLRASQVRLGPTTLQVEPGEGVAVAVTTLSVTGRLGDTEVSALGYERVPFVLSEGGWRWRDGPAPRLAAALAALEGRRRALEAGDREALRALRPPGADGLGGPELERFLAAEGRTYRVARWRLRSERAEVRVAEDYRMAWQTAGGQEGREAAGPREAAGLRTLTLHLSGQKLFFSPGLM